MAGGDRYLQKCLHLFLRPNAPTPDTHARGSIPLPEEGEGANAGAVVTLVTSRNDPLHQIQILKLYPDAARLAINKGKQ